MSAGSFPQPWGPVSHLWSATPDWAKAFWWVGIFLILLAS